MRVMEEVVVVVVVVRKRGSVGVIRISRALSPHIITINISRGWSMAAATAAAAAAVASAPRRTSSPETQPPSKRT